ncbi:carbohydrate ABC transporter permease [Ferrovibrio sp.]|uniref:carbohydrate ABC transporter permease n=1 Tax=Ferrovibrio sp. TaxID=1917215 RepID=UPI0025B9E7C8|nr:sugar ABC transporter permease [Ferrovibrio sp.]
MGFVFAPLALSLYYSVHRVRYYQLGDFNGLQNYIDILSHRLFLNSFLVTCSFSLMALTLTFATGFGLALFLNRDTAGSILLRTVVLLPYVIAMLVGSMLLKWIFSTDAGLVPLAAAWFDVASPTVLADPEYAMAAMVANGIWRDSAFAMVMLLAGLRSIPPNLIQAARIDGAGSYMIFRRIILPLLRPAILITLIRLLLHFANVLTFPLILTGGGPNNATDTLALRIFRIGFEDFDLGKANAMAIVLCLFNIAAVVLLLAVFRKTRGGQSL